MPSLESSLSRLHQVAFFARQKTDNEFAEPCEPLKLRRYLTPSTISNTKGFTLCPSCANIMFCCDRSNSKSTLLEEESNFVMNTFTFSSPFERIFEKTKRYKLKVILTQVLAMRCLCYHMSRLVKTLTDDIVIEQPSRLLSIHIHPEDT